MNGLAESVSRRSSMNFGSNFSAGMIRSTRSLLGTLLATFVRSRISVVRRGRKMESRTSAFCFLSLDSSGASNSLVSFISVEAFTKSFNSNSQKENEEFSKSFVKALYHDKPWAA